MYLNLFEVNSVTKTWRLPERERLSIPLFLLAQKPRGLWKGILAKSVESLKLHTQCRQQYVYVVLLLSLLPLLTIPRMLCRVVFPNSWDTMTLFAFNHVFRGDKATWRQSRRANTRICQVRTSSNCYTFVRGTWPKHTQSQCTFLSFLPLHTRFEESSQRSWADTWQ